MNREETIEKIKNKYGDRFLYDDVEDKKYNYTTKIKLVCKEHGIFEKPLRSLIYRNQNCKKCLGWVFDTESFIKKAREVHGDKYDYSLSEYVNTKHPIKIICPVHGVYEHIPNKHVSGRICPQCAMRKKGKKRELHEDDVKIQFKEVHGDKYDYSLVDYKGTHEKVKIICPEHGIFEQIPLNHKRGQNCPICAKGESQYEIFVESFFTKNNIKYKRNIRKTIYPLELDFYLPEYNVAIEVDGIYWHGEKKGKDKNYHLNKTNLCKDKNIKLLHITDYELKFKKRIVESKLKSILNISKRKIHGRKCEVREIDTKLKSKFLNKYHLQGNDKASVKLGLFYKDKLVSVMTFCKRRIAMGKKSSEEGEYELSRYCGNFNFYVIGGASKLLKYFERNYTPSKIVTYADKRWSMGDLYFKLGFTHTHDSKPNYWYFDSHYIHNEKIYHRFNFRKSELSKKLDKFDPNKTEWQNMKDNMFDRFWDCGNMVFEKTY
jgi:very-short-patch-repair endonuclease